MGFNIHGAGFTVTETDEAGGQTTTLSVGEGTLTVTPGDSGVTVTGGNGTGTVTLTGTVAQVNALLTNAGSGTVVYLNANDVPAWSTSLTVTVNDQGNTGTDPGLTGTATTEEASASQTINITRVNDPPAFSALDGGETFTEGGTAVPVDTNVAIADAELDALNANAGNYAGATLTVARQGGTNSDDAFSVASGGNLTVIDGPSGGGSIKVGGAGGFVIAQIADVGDNDELSIKFENNGAEPTRALVNEVMRAIRYGNNSNDPPGDVTLAWTFSDGNTGGQGTGGALSDSGTATVGIDGVNDEPELSATAVNPTFTEGGAAANLFSGASARTVETGQKLTALTLTVTNLRDGSAEILNVDGSDVSLIDGNTVTTSTNGLSVSVGVSGSTATVGFSGASLSEAALANLVDGLTYRNSSDDPTTSPNRIVTITELVDSGSGTGSNDNTATLSFASSVTVDAVDDAPQLTATARNPTFTEGGTAADLFASVSSSTVEAGQTFAAMTLTVTNVTEGSSEILSFDGSDVALTHGNSVTTATNNLGVSVSVSGTTATVSFSGANLDTTALQTLIDGLTYRNTSQVPTAANRVVTITQLVDNGSSTGANENTATLNVASTVGVVGDNDAPVFSDLNGGATFTEGGSAVAIDGNVSVADLELDALNGGDGNYDGASLTIERQGGADPQDTYSFSSGGGISLVGGNLVKGGKAIASFAPSAGTLTVNFTDANGAVPTSADVDAILQRITYANVNDAPPANVTLAWSFNDGNSGAAQGSSGALSGTGTASMAITGINDAPTVSTKITEAFTSTIITSSANDAMSVFAADLDGDGDVDVLSASSGDNTIAWYANDGSGGFSSARVITSGATGATSVYAADLDGDGDMDVLSASAGDNTIAWYANNGAGTFSAAQNINTGATGASSVYATDVDGDGDVDVLSASPGNHTIAWYANNGSGTFSAAQNIDTGATGASSVHATDLDGDGDIDVLSASRYDSTIAWYENDGSQAFIKRVIANDALGARSVYAVDIDDDGDVDVLSASAGDHTVAWYENNGSEAFTEREITTGASGARSVYAADLDSDGDIDVLSASQDDDTIAWHENDGSAGFTKRTITSGADGASAVFAMDLDDDGDADVVSASENDNTVAWHENTWTQSVAEDASLTFNAANGNRIQIGDADAAGSALRTTVSASHGTVTVTSGSGATVSNNGTASVTIIGTASQINTALDGLVYSGNANYNGADALTVVVNDQGNTGSGGAKSATRTVDITVSAVNDVPMFSNLNGGASYPVGGTAVVIDSNVTVSDVELDAADDYDGATLTIARQGGANSDDVFSFFDGNGIALEGGSLVKGGKSIASFSSSAGTLTVSFTDANGSIPTATDVYAVLQQIAYANDNSARPASVTLGWTFNDGTDSGTGSATVNITGVAVAKQSFFNSTINTGEDLGALAAAAPPTRQPAPQVGLATTTPAIAAAQPRAAEPVETAAGAEISDGYTALTGLTEESAQEVSFLGVPLTQLASYLPDGTDLADVQGYVGLFALIEAGTTAFGPEGAPGEPQIYFFGQPLTAIAGLLPAGTDLASIGSLAELQALLPSEEAAPPEPIAEPPEPEIIEAPAEPDAVEEPPEPEAVEEPLEPEAVEEPPEPEVFEEPPEITEEPPPFTDMLLSEAERFEREAARLAAALVQAGVAGGTPATAATGAQLL